MGTSSETLGLVVEFSIGLGGFSAIVSVFLQGSAQLTPLDRFRILNLLSLALAPAFIAFFHIGIEGVLRESDYATRASSSALAACILLFASFIAKRRSALPPDQRALLGSGVYLLMGTAALLNLAAQVFSVAMLEGAASYGVLYFGLVLLLLQAVFQFVRIIVARPAQSMKR